MEAIATSELGQYAAIIAGLGLFSVLMLALYKYSPTPYINLFYAIVGLVLIAIGAGIYPTSLNLFGNARIEVLLEKFQQQEDLRKSSDSALNESQERLQAIEERLNELELRLNTISQDDPDLSPGSDLHDQVGSDQRAKLGLSLSLTSEGFLQACEPVSSPPGKSRCDIVEVVASGYEKGGVDFRSEAIPGIEHIPIDNTEVGQELGEHLEVMNAFNDEIGGAVRLRVTIGRDFSVQSAPRCFKTKEAITGLITGGESSRFPMTFFFPQDEPGYSDLARTDLVENCRIGGTLKILLLVQPRE